MTEFATSLMTVFETAPLIKIAYIIIIKSKL